MLHMSKVKSPQEKKRNSLLKDRRNVYGENPASSRKNIRRGKQRSHMQLRRALAEELRSLKGTNVEVPDEIVEARAKDRIVALARSSFKKSPDQPLAVVVKRKIERRKKQREEQSQKPLDWTKFQEQLRAEARLLREMRRK